MLLDVVCMFGDIALVLLAFPIRTTSSWWKESIFNRHTAYESETESLSTERNNLHPGANHMYPGLPGQTPPNALQFPRKVSSDPRRPGPSRISSSESGHNVTQADHRAQNNIVQCNPANGTLNGLYSHQLWNPPPSSYSDADDSANGSIPDTKHSRHDSDEDLDLRLKMEETARQQFDEWRQYPPFPSAYPPTPIVATSSRLPSAPTRLPNRPPDTMFAEIPEDESQQDFRESLLPPRKPLNPSYVGSSDDYLTHPGVQTTSLINDEPAVVTDSDMADEEEDEFNTTLRTPLPLLGSARSHIRDAVPANRPISFASSVTSKSTALTTAGEGSSLGTRSSSESLLSAAMSMISSSDSSAVVGKKRPLPRNRAVSIKNKTRVINGTAARNIPRMQGLHNLPARGLSATRKVHRHGPVLSAIEMVSEDKRPSVGDVDEQKGPTKRRKIALSPTHVVPSSRPIRHRIARYATPPPRAVRGRINAAAPSRPSARLRPGGISPDMASSSDDHVPEHRARSRGRNVTKTT